MKARELRNLGLPDGEPLKIAQQACGRAADDGMSKRHIRDTLIRLLDDPERFTSHSAFSELAQKLLAGPEKVPFEARDEPAPWQQWGDDLDPKSIEQIQHACELPVSYRAALMPDAHVGYGLPIGGVLATEDAIIPYAVGVDIACRMKLTVLDLPANAIEAQTDRLINAIERETEFGVGAKFRKPRDHDVMDRDWSVSRITQQNKDKARSQLGTSGSGNHFVEFGILKLDQPDLGLEPGEYLALMSHSGSRGTGAAVASHYSKLAMEQHPELPKHLKHLAWLDMDSEAGQEYFAAMNLMGEYAAANHAVIHREIARNLSADVMADVENHHNFAWKEQHDGRTLFVHRKGATPAGAGVLGVIPGSMASPAYVVRGKGNAASLESASHGAGRVMSRRQAKSTLTWSDAKKLLNERGVRLLSAGLDEVPMVYKDIDEVMAAQRDLVDVVAKFHPRIVKMAPGGRAED